MRALRILVVEDEVLIALDLVQRLERLGHSVIGPVETGEDAVQLATVNLPDLVLMDIRLRGPMDGIEAAELIQQRLDLPVIYLTAYADEETVRRAEKTIPFGYLQKPVSDLDLKVAFAMGLAKHNAESRLRESERNQAATLRSIADGIVTCDRHGTVTLINPVAEGILGWTQKEARGQPVSEILRLFRSSTREKLPCPLARAIRDRIAIHLSEDTMIRTRDGREVPIEDSVAPIRMDEVGPAHGAVFAFREARKASYSTPFTERQSTKQASLGLVAGGIAHDFNNLLTPISGYAEMLRNSLPEGSPAHALLTEIERSTRRGVELTQQMLAYAGKNACPVAPLDLSQLIHNLRGLIQTAARQATVHFDLASSLPPFSGDEKGLNQVVLNLVTNAVESLPDQGGVIQLRTRLLEAKAEDLISPYFPEHFPTGRYLVLEIQDTGCGMTRDVLERLFDPFFTTKFAGRGLGLAAVHGIVRIHRGLIKVETNLGQGSLFQVLLPVTGPITAEAPTATIPKESKIQRTILMAEDDSAVRSLIERILLRGGYRAILASGGRQALALFKEKHPSIDLLLLDLNLPGLDAEEILQEVLLINASARVVIMSGSCETDLRHRFSKYPIRGILVKPFSPMALMQTLEMALLP